MRAYSLALVAITAVSTVSAIIPATPGRKAEKLADEEDARMDAPESNNCRKIVEKPGG
jgi:hypothetical protein